MSTPRYRPVVDPRTIGAGIVARLPPARARSGYFVVWAGGERPPRGKVQHTGQCELTVVSSRGGWVFPLPQRSGFRPWYGIFAFRPAPAANQDIHRRAEPYRRSLQKLTHLSKNRKDEKGKTVNPLVRPPGSRRSRAPLGQSLRAPPYYASAASAPHIPA